MQNELLTVTIEAVHPADLAAADTLSVSVTSLQVTCSNQDHHLHHVKLASLNSMIRCALFYAFDCRKNTSLLAQQTNIEQYS